MMEDTKTKYLSRSQRMVFMALEKAEQVNDSTAIPTPSKLRVDPDDPFDLKTPATAIVPDTNDAHPHFELSTESENNFQEADSDNDVDPDFVPSDSVVSKTSYQDTDSDNFCPESEIDEVEIPLQGVVQAKKNMMDKSPSMTVDATQEEITDFESPSMTVDATQKGITDFASPSMTIKATQNEDNNAKKKARPKRPCVFCGELQTQLARHLMRQHKDEQEVKSALTLPKSKRLRKINDIKKKEIFAHNIKLKKDGKALMRERSQGSTSLTMCLGCKGFYCKRRIAKHKKKL